MPSMMTQEWSHTLGNEMRNRQVLAVEGGGFNKYGKGMANVAFLLAYVTCPTKLLFKNVEVDGLDATEKLAEAIKTLGGKEEIDLVVSSSVPVAGFNLIDAQLILAKFGIPTVFVLREKPDEEAVEAALAKHFEDAQIRLKVLRGSGPIREFLLEGSPVWLECVGIPFDEAFEIVKRLAIFGPIPEPLRIAKMAARAISTLERPQ